MPPMSAAPETPSPLDRLSPPAARRALSALSAEQRAALGAALQAQRRELTRRLSEIQGGLSRVEHAAEQLAQDGDDAPQRDADREVDLARNDWTAQALVEVTQAIARLDDPDFGHCSDCGDPIAVERLRIEPWTHRCTACQSRAEAR